MEPQQIKREQEREEKDRFLDEISKSGAVKDLVEYKEDLKETNVDHSNAHKQMRTYMSKRSNIQTFVHETYQEAKDIEDDIEKAESNDRELQGYMDDGWVPLQLYRDQEEVIQKYKKILQYMEQQDEIQLMLLREIYEEMEKMRGADISKEIMEEVKEFLNEMFEKKFDTDKEKIKLINEALDDQIAGLEDKIERRIENVREELDSSEDRERKMLYFMAQNMNAMNNMADQFQREIDTNEKIDKVPTDIAERMKELGVYGELDEDLMKNLEKENIDTDSTIDSKDELEDEMDEGVSESVGQGEDTRKGQENKETEKEKDKESPEQKVSKEETQDTDSKTDEEDDESGDDVESSNESNTPEEKKLVHKIPHSESESVADVAKAIDEGCKTKEEVREYLETKNPALPTTQIKKMLNNEYVEESEIPDQLVPE